jgi:hypothetical protein
MAGLAQNRNTPELGDQGRLVVYPLADNVLIYVGALVCLDSNGNATPGATATGLKAVGRAERAYPGGVPGIPGSPADNTVAGHAAGAVSVLTRRGVFKFDNSATDPVGVANAGTPCFVVDDHTVSATDGAAHQSVAGAVVKIDSDGVWVDFTRQSALAA